MNVFILRSWPASSAVKPDNWAIDAAKPRFSSTCRCSISSGVMGFSHGVLQVTEPLPPWERGPLGRIPRRQARLPGDAGQRPALPALKATYNPKDDSHGPHNA